VSVDELRANAAADVRLTPEQLDVHRTGRREARLPAPRRRRPRPEHPHPSQRSTHRWGSAHALLHADFINRLGPEIVLLQEVWNNPGYNQFEILRRLTGMNGVFWGQPHDGGDKGEAVLSRFPLTDLGYRATTIGAFPSKRTWVVGKCEVDLGGLPRPFGSCSRRPARPRPGLGDHRPLLRPPDRRYGRRACARGRRRSRLQRGRERARKPWVNHGYDLAGSGGRRADLAVCRPPGARTRNPRTNRRSSLILPVTAPELRERGAGVASPCHRSASVAVV
jgi:hypothetical protein